MDVADLHRRAIEYFAGVASSVRDDQWSTQTPCADWDVRALVNHVVGEERWTPPLFAGQTIEQVGDQFDGDLLGADPRAAVADSARAAAAAASEPGAMESTVHLSFGDTPGSEYALQLFADHLVHGWDLATAIGADDTLDPELVAACAEWFSEREEMYRGGGAIGPRPTVPEDADAQTRLLAAFGRGR
ncbi:MAG: TIGR03086 family metal-binding protein [Actinomycetota bacterium]